jgi:uncharacterized integral membrane protein
MDKKTSFLILFTKLYKKVKFIVYLLCVIVAIILFANFMLQNRQKIDITFLNYHFDNLSLYFVCILFFIAGSVIGFFCASLVILKNILIKK